MPKFVINTWRMAVTNLRHRMVMLKAQYKPALPPEDDHAEDKGKGDVPEECPDKNHEVCDGDHSNAMIDVPMPKVWNDDKDNGNDLDKDECDKGVALNGTSELAPKEDHAGDGKGKADVPEKCPDQDHEVCEENRPDSMIDAPMSKEPEVIDLTDVMEIDLTEVIEIDLTKDVEIDLTKDVEIELIDDVDVSKTKKKAENKMDTDSMKNDTIASTPEKVLPANEVEKHSSQDMATPDDNVADLESGIQEASDQHHEVQSDAKNSRSMETGHEGKKSKRVKLTDDNDEENNAEQKKLQQEIKCPNQQRLSGNPELSCPEKFKISDKPKSAEDVDQVADKASEYEHITNENNRDVQAMDTAIKEQASKQPCLKPQDSDKLWCVIDKEQSSEANQDLQSADHASNQSDL